MTTPTPSAEPVKKRRTLPIILLILATIVAIVSVLALWAKRQALETSTWVETSTELLEDKAIQDALADFVVNTIYDNVDVQAEIASALPPNAALLAGPISGGLRQVATRATQEALQQEKVQALWEDANRVAHERLLAAARGRGEVCLDHERRGHARSDAARQRRCGRHRHRRRHRLEAARGRRPHRDLEVGRARNGADGGRAPENACVGPDGARAPPLCRRDLVGPRMAPRDAARGRILVHRDRRDRPVRAERGRRRHRRLPERVVDRRHRGAPRMGDRDVAPQGHGGVADHLRRS